MDETSSGDVPEDADVVTDVGELTTQNALMSLFDAEAKTRIIIALLAKDGYPLNPSGIVKHAGLSNTKSWYDHRDDLLATGLIKQTGNAGNSPLYAIDTDDPRVEALHILEDLTRMVLNGKDIDFEIEYTKVTSDK